MPYDEKLAERVRGALKKQPDVEEKKMMGGLTFMVGGKMCVGVLRGDLMARIAPEEHESALKRKGCREMDFTGRPSRGFVFVGPECTGTDEGLRSWIALALDFNARAKPSRKKRKQ
jgi:TfoX/Sxy family transcriptional regulator of competence genes